jgi:arylsulfatase A-like enzyme
MTERRRPNVLLLMTDQHRVDTLGCYGNTVCQTPAIDALAKRGVRLDNAFTPTAICTPARASLLTGVLPFRHALLANYERNVGYREELDGPYRPFSHGLRAAGYQVGHVGKWHVGKELGPADHGFDGVHYPGWGNPVSHPDYRAWLSERGLPEFRLRSEVRGIFPNGEPGNLLAGVIEGPAESTFEHYLADRTIERLERYSGSGQPFFLACDWFGPHLPYCIPEDYYRRYSPDDVTLPRSIAETFAGKPAVQRSYSEHWTFDSVGIERWKELTAAYWGYVSLIDEQVGRVVSTLQRLDLVDNTVVFFTADHGEFTGAHRLHDKGPAMYDDIYRVPFVATGPGIEGGRVEKGIVTLTDFAPTLCDIAGMEKPGYYDGRSVWPLLRGDQVGGWPTELVAEFHGHHFPYPQRMLRTDRYKLVVNPADRNELYDLVDDPDELLNRYDQPALADVRGSMMRRLYTLLRERGDNFYHWMTSMYEVGAKGYDAALSDLDTAASARPAR